MVFTVPAQVAAITFHNKAVVYDLLFKTAAETLLTIAADPKHLGGRIGVTAVLHTWGSALTHHSHVHCIVPGGGLSPDERWVACRPKFSLPVRVLSRLFRRLFLDRLAEAHAAGKLVFVNDSVPLEDRAPSRAISPLCARRRGGGPRLPPLQAFGRRPSRQPLPHAPGPASETLNINRLQRCSFFATLEVSAGSLVSPSSV